MPNRPPDAKLSDLSDPVFLDGGSVNFVFDKTSSKTFRMDGESLWEITSLASKWKIRNESVRIDRKTALETASS